MTREKLYEFLNELPEQDPETSSEFMYQNISEFLDILQYDTDVIFYELGGRYKVDPAHLDEDTASREGDVYRFIQADAGVARSTSSRPYIVLESKYSEELPFDEDIEIYNNFLSEELSLHIDAFDPVFFVYLTNFSLVIYDGGRGSNYDLRDISMTDAGEILELLRAPEELPREIAPSIKSAETSSIQTKHFELDTVDYTRALREVDEAESTAEKGDSFERLAVLLFSGISFLQKRDRQLRTHTGEIDVVIEYMGSEHLTIFDDYSRFILAECKNWSGSVGSDQIRVFKDRLNEHRLDFGVFFARNGISGDTGADASKRVQDIFRDEGIAIIVISDLELKQIKRGVSFYEILDQKLYELRFSE
ncbi:restriction endonuclease [Halomicroarcula sp. F28]|uniref:restriction endonuclease n=1 Tax=Haloarcula salinisoli TaxID=2487746 RepID=UPI001C73883B|nr:restriction endonuclease [Halomicroarcula salinisoli]MBX0286625.1 restriction endonuclease [Halomicroarcula salinisoli]